MTPIKNNSIRESKLLRIKKPFLFLQRVKTSITKISLLGALLNFLLNTCGDRPKINFTHAESYGLFIKSINYYRKNCFNKTLWDVRKNRDPNKMPTIRSNPLLMQSHLLLCICIEHSETIALRRQEGMRS